MKLLFGRTGTDSEEIISKCSSEKDCENIGSKDIGPQEHVGVPSMEFLLRSVLSVRRITLLWMVSRRLKVGPHPTYVNVWFADRRRNPSFSAVVEANFDGTMSFEIFSNTNSNKVMKFLFSEPFLLMSYSFWQWTNLESIEFHKIFFLHCEKIQR